MKLGASHCFYILLLFILLQAIVFSSATRTKIIIRSDEDPENCTRIDDILICPCNITYNGTYYPCWIPLTNATFPTPNNTCFECPFGSYSNETNANCTRSCGAGSCMDPYTCDLCPSGSCANTTGSVSCTPCEAGYFARYMGSHNCSICASGTYSSVGSAACTSCPVGHFASSPGSGKCDPCPAGEFSQQEGSSECQKCGQGSFNSFPGSSTCTACGAGYYSPNYGQSSRDACVKCPAGNYCPDTRTPYPVSCPRNYYCTEGASAAILCSPLYQSRPGQSSCAPSMGFYLLIFGIVGLVAVTLVVVWRWFTTKQRISAEPQQNLEIGRLIPKPRDGPVYSGL